MWCDNDACCLVTRDASSLKRLAYIARRVRFIQELKARRVISIQNIKGIKNPADVLTKYYLSTWAKQTTYATLLGFTTVSLPIGGVVRPEMQDSRGHPAGV